MRPHLNAGLGQVDLEGHLLAHEDVGVARLGEQVLEHVQLSAREGRPLAPLLPWCCCETKIVPRIRKRYKKYI